MIEADESGVPLLVLTADRPPELRGTGANQTIDQIKLYGGAVRWFCEVGVPEGPARARPVLAVAGRAGVGAGGRDRRRQPGPVHLNVAFRDPLVPDAPRRAPGCGPGRPGGRRAVDAVRRRRGELAALDLPWTERGVIVAGDGGYDPAPLAELAGAAAGRCWPSRPRRPGAGARPYRPTLPAGPPEFLAAPGPT